MKNKQVDKQRELSTITYEPIFEEIYKHLNEIKIKSVEVPNSVNPGEKIERGYIFEGLHNVAYRVARSLYNDVKNEDGFKQMFHVDYSKSPQDITLNFTDEKIDSALVNKLCSELDENLNLSNLKLIGDSLYKYKVKNNYIKRNDKVNFGVNIEYDISSQIKFAESLPDQEATKALNNHFREDKVVFKYDAKELKNDIKISLINFLDSDASDYLCLDEDEIDEIVEEIEKNDCLVKEMYDFITQQQKGCLSRVSNYLYLEYALNNIDVSKLNETDSKTYNLLKNYVRRFEMFEDFCTESLINGSSYNYTISKSRSLLDEFRKATIYDFLPLIGKCSQNAVFANDRNLTKSVEQCGIYFKFDGEVANHDIQVCGLKGRKITSSLLYHIASVEQILENSKNPEVGDKEKGLVSAFVKSFLIKFFLTNLEDDSYNPVEELRKDLEGLSSVQDVQSAYNIIKPINNENMLNYNKNISKNCKSIIGLVKRSLESGFEASNHSVSQTYKRIFTIFPGYLPKDILEYVRNYSLSNKPRTHKMRYTTLIKEDSLKIPALFTINYEIKFETGFIKHLVKNEDTVNNIFNFKDLYNMNVIFYPQHGPNFKDEDGKKIMDSINKKAFNNVLMFRNIYIPYLVDVNLFNIDIARFIHNTTYSILVTCLLTILIEHSRVQSKLEDSHKLHVNLLRIHQESEKDANKVYVGANEFIALFSKRLSLILSQKYSVNAQGFDLTKENVAYKYSNAIRSMYSTLPQVFKLNSKKVIETNKIAMVIATSMVHDKASKWSNIEEAFSSLLGQVILFDSINGETSVKRYKTFCHSYKKDELFTKPIALTDIGVDLKEKGYEHIIYLAQAPYTSKMLEGIEDQELYFMNEDVIKLLSLNGELNVYPIFYNTSKVLDCRSEELKQRGVALYIDDTHSMEESLYKDLNGIIPVFNLYSAQIASNLNKTSFYNSLITYMTLRDIYSSSTINSKITSALIAGSLKKDITRALALYHFANYQKNEKGKLDIKINPYEDLIGDNGIAKRSRDEYNLHPVQRGNGFTMPRKVYHNSFSLCNFIAQNAFNYKVKRKEKNK